MSECSIPSGRVLPNLSAPEGQVLLPQEYQALGYGCAMLNLAELLVKPGWERMTRVTHVEQLIPWSGQYIFSSRPANYLKARFKQGRYHYQSPVDGARLSYSLEDVLSLSQSLGLDHCLISADFINQPESYWRPLLEQYQDMNIILEYTEAFAAMTNVSDSVAGYCYTHCNSENSFCEQVLQSIARHNHKTQSSLLIMASGDFSLDECRTLLAAGVDGIDSRTVYRDAMEGRLYTQQGVIDINHDVYRDDFRPIDGDCSCSTCHDYTRAYFHHLLSATPLLSMRLQMIHNLHFLSGFNLSA